ncbi:MAG: CAP domain-containing protein [Vulcanimicrobiaceae bacterium]
MWMLAGMLAMMTSLAVPAVTTVIAQPAASADEIVALITQPIDLEPSPRDAAAMLADLNRMRAARGLPPLRNDARLDQIARSRALDMLDRRYFGHVSPDGKTPYQSMNAAGVRFDWAGENLALDASEAAAFYALTRSLGHRENMLESHYARVGIAAVRTANAGEIFVQEFVGPADR